MSSFPSPPKSSKPSLALGLLIALAIMAANLAGYVYYRATQGPAASDPAFDSTAAEGEIGAQPEEPPLGRTTSPDEAGPTSVASLALDQRELGVQALRVGDYDKASARFEAALKLDPEVPDASVLVEVAKRLADAERAKPPAPEPGTPTPRPEAQAATTRRAETHRARLPAAERRERPKPEATLLVSTVPAGLLIEVDERPVELSPARVRLDVGRPHRVRLRRGPEVLYEETIELRAGQTWTIDEDFTPSAPAASTSDRKTDGGASSLARDRELDLLALVDRDGQQRPRGPEATPPAPAAQQAEAPSAPASSARRAPPPRPPEVGSPGLLVFWPGRSPRALRSSLVADLSGIDVRVISRPKELASALTTAPPDAVLAPPQVLRRNGLSPVLTSDANAKAGRYLAASFKSPIDPSDLEGVTLGIVDEFGRRGTPVFVARLFKGSAPAEIRRVGEVEDLLPLLQFDMAQAVLVRERDFPTLRSRTRQQLYTIPLEVPPASVAVAFVDGGRGSSVEQALRKMQESTKRALGLDSWTR